MNLPKPPPACEGGVWRVEREKGRWEDIPDQSNIESAHKEGKFATSVELQNGAVGFLNFDNMRIKCQDENSSFSVKRVCPPVQWETSFVNDNGKWEMLDAFNRTTVENEYLGQREQFKYFDYIAKLSKLPGIQYELTNPVTGSVEAYLRRLCGCEGSKTACWEWYDEPEGGWKEYDTPQNQLIEYAYANNLEHIRVEGYGEGGEATVSFRQMLQQSECHITAVRRQDPTELQTTSHQDNQAKFGKGQWQYQDGNLGWHNVNGEANDVLEFAFYEKHSDPVQLRIPELSRENLVACLQADQFEIGTLMDQYTNLEVGIRRMLCSKQTEKDNPLTRMGATMLREQGLMQHHHQEAQHHAQQRRRVEYWVWTTSTPQWVKLCKDECEHIEREYQRNLKEKSEGCTVEYIDGAKVWFDFACNMLVGTDEPKHIRRVQLPVPWFTQSQKTTSPGEEVWIELPDIISDELERQYQFAETQSNGNRLWTNGTEPYVAVNARDAAYRFDVQGMVRINTSTGHKRPILRNAPKLNNQTVQVKQSQRQTASRRTTTVPHAISGDYGGQPAGLPKLQQHPQQQQPPPASFEKNERKALRDRLVSVNYRDPITLNQETKSVDLTKFYQLREQCRQQQKRWKDAEFQPGDTSFYGKSPKPGYRHHTWKRLPDSQKDDHNMDWVFYRGRFRASDIEQRHLGTCWFVAMLAVIAERPELISRIIPKKSPAIEPSGMYCIIFYRNGVPTPIQVDDYVPVMDYPNVPQSEKHKVLGTRGKNNTAWVPIVEKAYAKMYGSYQAIIAGTPAEALADLTGFVCQSVDLEKKGNKTEIWGQLQQWTRMGHIFGTSCGHEGVSVSHLEKLGLEEGHAYSIMGTAEVVDKRNKLHRILKLRNPYGRGEWKGDWSDNSGLWTPEARQRLRVKSDDDGTFWIGLDAYMSYFFRLDVCFVGNDSLPTYVSCVTRPFAWSANVKEHMPHCLNATMDMIDFHLQTPSLVGASVIQTNKRGQTESTEYNDISGGVLHVKTLDSTIELVSKKLLDSSNHTALMSGEILPPGAYTCLMCSFLGSTAHKTKRSNTYVFRVTIQPLVPIPQQQQQHPNAECTTNVMFRNPTCCSVILLRILLHMAMEQADDLVWLPFITCNTREIQPSVYLIEYRSFAGRLTLVINENTGQQPQSRVSACKIIHDFTNSCGVASSRDPFGAVKEVTPPPAPQFAGLPQFNAGELPPRDTFGPVNTKTEDVILPGEKQLVIAVGSTMNGSWLDFKHHQQVPPTTKPRHVPDLPRDHVNYPIPIG